MPLFVSAVSVAPAALAAGSPVVVESRSGSATVRGSSSAVAYTPPIEEPDVSGMESQYQLQLLQQEVMELRGVVEELQHEVDRMKAVQDDRYLELDARLQQVMQEQAGDGEPALDASAAGAATPVESGQLGEKSLYDMTQQLIRNRQYDLAIEQLESLIGRFPDGRYAPNAYYWLGQVYAAKPEPDFEKARQALAQVIGYFPEHPKVPDATFALGKVYHILGDCQRAQDLLQQVISQYEGKSAAKLAENYLRESVRCDP